MLSIGTIYSVLLVSVSEQWPDVQQEYSVPLIKDQHLSQ